MSYTPELVIVEVVTREHGETFAEEWGELSASSCAMVEAFTLTGVVTWPEEGVDAQARFLDIEDEVTERVFYELRPAIAEAFVSAANEILARERGRNTHPSR